MMREMFLKYRTLLICAALIPVYLGSIWQRPLFRPDEFRYAEIAREMIVSGDWILPHQLGMVYFEKPVLGHWLNALGELICGEVPMAVRLFPAVCTLLTALLIALLCRRAGERQLGMIAPVIYLTCGLVFAVGTYGVLDAPFVLFLFGTVTGGYFAWSECNPRRRAGYLVLAGVSCALAFLTKGFLALVLPTALFVPFLIWQREWKRIFTLPWIPLLTAALVALPWAVAVHHADGDFWRYFTEVEHFQRAVDGGGAGDNRSEPFWYFIPVLLGGALPWLLFLPAMWAGCRTHFRAIFQLPLIRFAACMTGVWFLLFSISSGKLATYVLPCFPGVAILFGYGLIRYAQIGVFNRADRILEWLIRLILSLTIVVFLLQTAGKFTRKIPSELLLYGRSENYFIPILATVVMLIWCRMAQRERSGGTKFTYFCVGLCFVMLAVHGSMPKQFYADSIAPEQFIRRMVAPQLHSAETMLVSDVPLAAAAAWSLKRSDVYLFHKPGEFHYALNRPENAGRFFTTQELATLIRREPERKIVVLTRSEDRVRELPSPKRYTRQGDYFMVCYDANREGAEQ